MVRCKKPSTEFREAKSSCFAAVRTHFSVDLKKLRLADRACKTLRGLAKTRSSAHVTSSRIRSWDRRFDGLRSIPLLALLAQLQIGFLLK
jgi:hypothetical protein